MQIIESFTVILEPSFMLYSKSFQMYSKKKRRNQSKRLIILLHSHIHSDVCVVVLGIQKLMHIARFHYSANLISPVASTFIISRSRRIHSQQPPTNTKDQSIQINKKWYRPPIAVSIPLLANSYRPINSEPSKNSSAFRQSTSVLVTQTLPAGNGVPISSAIPTLPSPATVLYSLTSLWLRMNLSPKSALK